MSLIFFLKPHYSAQVVLPRRSGADFLKFFDEVDYGSRQRSREKLEKTLRLREDIEALIDGKPRIFRSGDKVSPEDYDLILLLMMMEE